MRAPLVVAAVWLGAGVAAGLHWPVPTWGGPLLLPLTLVGALAAAAGALGPERNQAGVPGRTRPGPGRRVVGRGRAPGGRLWGDGRVLVLYLGCGLLLGMTARSAGDRSCRGRVPADVDLSVRATVAERTGERLRLEVDEMTAEKTRIPCLGELPARFEGDVPDSGARLAGRGRWWSPPGARGGPARPGILLLDSVRVITAGRPSPTGVLRRVARDRVDSVFTRNAALAAALLLAQRDGLDPEVRERYARAGLSHLLAISGLHVGVIAGILLLSMGALRLGRRAGSAAAGVGTLAYVGLLGAPHSAARAALQVVFVLTARGLQRPSRTESLIAAAALLLLAYDPAGLLAPGFQLSFAGVAGILALRRPLLRRLRGAAGIRIGRVPLGRWLADGLATSTAATVATAPIVAWHFGRIAPIGIVANLVAIPLLSAAVPALALALGVGTIWLPAGRFLAEAGNALLDTLDWTAGVASAAPGGSVALPGSVAVLWTFAVVAGYALSRRLGETRPGIRTTAWAGIAAAVLIVGPVRLPTDRVEIHVIDVGQGDAIGIRSPAGRWILVDAGIGTSSYDAGASRVVPYLSRRGVRRLEGIILTHPDADHVGGAAAVVEALRPRWIVDPGAVAAKVVYLHLLEAAAGAGVEWVGASRGMTLELDGMTAEFLHPDRSGGSEPEDANDVSVVVRIQYGEFSVLLTGDAPAAVETRLVQRYGDRLEADVLKVGHHGSRTSTTRGLLEATGASHAVISAGRGNRYGHPHPSVLARLDRARIVTARTDRHGTVVVRGTRGGQVDVSSERGGPLRSGP
jgi:competence protein ComEC